MRMLDAAWRGYRVKNLLRWKLYHLLGRIVWPLFALQDRLFNWRTVNDFLVEARLWKP